MSFPFIFKNLQNIFIRPAHFNIIGLFCQPITLFFNLILHVKINLTGLVIIMYDYKKDMGERIRTRRKRLSMTQEYVAEKLGISVKHFSEVERGLTGLSVENLIKLSDCLGLSLDYMIKGDTEHKTSNGVLSVPESIPNDKRELLSKLIEIGIQLSI